VPSAGSGKSQQSLNISFLLIALPLLLVTEQLLDQPSVLVSVPQKQTLRSGLYQMSFREGSQERMAKEWWDQARDEE